jgi:hypothetical protein
MLPSRSMFWTPTYHTPCGGERTTYFSCNGPLVSPAHTHTHQERERSTNLIVGDVRQFLGDVAERQRPLADAQLQVFAVGDLCVCVCMCVCVYVCVCVLN